MEYKIIKNNILGKMIFSLPLVLVIIASVALALPSISNNIDNPNMIAYFNADEGGHMDIIWHYYSGEKRGSFQWDTDYGLEMLYLADFARLVLSHFMHFTPGSFVLILRWLHLLALLFSFFALWRLVNYHFGNKWQPALAVLLLAVRPAFPYLALNLKPEPLVLLLTIIGLDCTLRIVENPFRKQYLYIAIACAAVASLVKYAGLFLLPAITAAMYFARRYQKEIYDKRVFAEIKIAWLLPALIGLILLTVPLALICFYIRKSTGLSWYAQFGLWGSLLQNKLMLFVCVAGLCLIFLSCLILLLGKSNNRVIKKTLKWINELNSHALIVLVIFLLFVFLFGFRWVINPQHFINICARFGSMLSSGQAISMLDAKGILYSFIHNLSNRIVAFDAVILILFVFYLGIEIYRRHQNFKSNLLRLFKRLVLLIFVILPFTVMFSMLRMAQHHMLPLLTVISILIIQGLYMLISEFNIRKLVRTVVTVLISALFITDISINTVESLKSRIYQFRQKEDVAYEVARWWQDNIPVNAKIIADHYIRVYIPEGYKNIKTLSWNEQGRAQRLRQLVDQYSPELIYYNEGLNATDEELMPPIKEILPGKKVELIKSFKNVPGHYQRRAGVNFVIYKIINE